MTHGNRQDHLDDALAMVASRRLMTLPKYMHERTKAVLGAAGEDKVHHHSCIELLSRLILSRCHIF